MVALEEVNRNLKNRNLYLEGQLKLKEEEASKDFSERVSRTIAHSGE